MQYLSKNDMTAAKFKSARLRLKDGQRMLQMQFSIGMTAAEKGLPDFLAQEAAFLGAHAGVEQLISARSIESQNLEFYPAPCTPVNLEIHAVDLEKLRWTRETREDLRLHFQVLVPAAETFVVWARRHFGAEVYVVFIEAQRELAPPSESATPETKAEPTAKPAAPETPGTPAMTPYQIRQRGGRLQQLLEKKKKAAGDKE